MIPVRNILYSFGFIFILINTTFFSRCADPLKQQLFPYKLHKPDKIYVMKNKVAEISGLSVVSDKEIALVEDETGSIYFYDLVKEKITRTVRFSKKGDFEDLKVIGDTAYVLRSDGRIFQVLNINGPESGIIKNEYKTALSDDNDTEGLCYDDQKKILLIACKGDAGIDKKMKKKKAVYSFDPATKLLSDTPVYLINMNDVENLAHGMHANFVEKLINFYRNTQPKVKFEPSGISIHPFTREIYVISSVGNALIIMDAEGNITQVMKLSPAVFRQPEGIAFDTQGNLYISNEGRNGRGNILKFIHEKNQHVTAEI